MAAVQQKRTTATRERKWASEDVGNILSLEHVNLGQPDQQLATAFYIMGLGFTRDPYLNVGLSNIWVNLGEQQFHLPTRDPQVLRGHVGLVTPDLDALEARLQAVQPLLAHTRFAYSPAQDHLAVTCPWGNRFRCYAPAARFGDMLLGLPYVELQVPRGTAAGIARFYSTVLQAPAALDTAGADPAARVRIGTAQQLVFRETDETLPPYDGHHVAIYVANFSAPHAWLEARGLIAEDVVNHQFRFTDIVDPDSDELLYRLEHEVRGLYHPMFRRPFVNRNPEQGPGRYARGHDAFVPFGR